VPTAKIREAFRAVDTSGNGFIDKSELGDLLTKLEEAKPASERRAIHQNDVLFALREIDTSGDGRIAFPEFKAWFLRTNVGHSGHKYNKLLVRDIVGKSKRSSYDLPEKGFTFGYVVPQDKHDAKAVMSNWHTGKPRLGGSDILKAREERGRPTNMKAATYGHINRPSTPMDRLLKGEFGVAEEKEHEYPDAPASAEKTKRGPTEVRATRATLAAMEATKEAMRASTAEAGGAGWKLKKFANVKPRVFG